GGGILAIPVLGLAYGLPQQAAQGTVLVMVAPNVLLAFWRYRQRVGADLRIAATLGLSALASAYPMARIATGLDPHGLRLPDRHGSASGAARLSRAQNITTLRIVSP